MNLSVDFDKHLVNVSLTARKSVAGRVDSDLVVYLERYYSLVLLIFGTIGNLLCLAVLSRKTFRRSSIGIYLRFLTLADLSALYTGALYFTGKSLFSINFRKTDELSCKFHRWLSFTACDLSSWALVLVSSARLVSVVWPMKRLITRRRVYGTIVLTVVLLLGANLPIFIIYGDLEDTRTNVTKRCVFVESSYETFYNHVFSWFVLLKFGFLPGGLLIGLNTALVVHVSRSGRAVEERKPRSLRDSVLNTGNTKTMTSKGRHRPGCRHCVHNSDNAGDSFRSKDSNRKQENASADNSTQNTTPCFRRKTFPNVLSAFNVRHKTLRHRDSIFKAEEFVSWQWKLRMMAERSAGELMRFFLRVKDDKSGGNYEDDGSKTNKTGSDKHSREITVRDIHVFVSDNSSTDHADFITGSHGEEKTVPVPASMALFWYPQSKKDRGHLVDNHVNHVTSTACQINENMFVGLHPAHLRDLFICPGSHSKRAAVSYCHHDKSTNRKNISETCDKSVNISDMRDKSVNISDMRDKSVNISDMRDKSVNISDMRDKSVNISDMRDKSVNISDKRDKSVNISDKRDKSVNISDMRDKSVTLQKNISSSTWRPVTSSSTPWYHNNIIWTLIGAFYFQDIIIKRSNTSQSSITSQHSNASKPSSTVASSTNTQSSIAIQHNKATHDSKATQCGTRKEIKLELQKAVQQTRCAGMDPETALNTNQDIEEREEQASSDSTDYKQASSDSTDCRQASSDSTDCKQASSDSTDCRQASSDSTDCRQASSDSTDYKQASSDSTDCRQASSDSTDYKQASSDSTDCRQASSDSTDYKQASSDSTDCRQASSDSTDCRQASSDKADHNQTSSNRTDHRQATSDTTDHYCCRDHRSGTQSEDVSLSLQNKNLPTRLCEGSDKIVTSNFRERARQQVQETGLCVEQSETEIFEKEHRTNCELLTLGVRSYPSLTSNRTPSSNVSRTACADISFIPKVLKENIYMCTDRYKSSEKKTKTEDKVYTACEEDKSKFPVSADQDVAGSITSGEEGRLPTGEDSLPISRVAKNTSCHKCLLTPKRRLLNVCKRRKCSIIQRASKGSSKSRSLTRTLLVLNTVFLLCNTPITVYLTGKTYIWPDKDDYSTVQDVFVTVANFTMYTSNSINFILYCVTGSRFRGQLILMFRDLYCYTKDLARCVATFFQRRG